MHLKIALLAGDGIGPEVVAESMKVLDAISVKFDHDFNLKNEMIGGCAIDKFGTALPDQTLETCNNSDAIILGAVGGPKYDNLEFSLKPERGLLKLRKELDLYSNLRPAQCFDALSDYSSLKPNIVSGLDIMIVRELSSGSNFGEPRGIEINKKSGERYAVNTTYYSESEIERVAISAFEIAKKRNKKVCSMEKANVMEVGVLWREVVQKIRDKSYPEIELSHMYADAGAMQLVRWPKQFDVIVTDNLFGDLLSDCAAMLTGSLGMLPSASLGNKNANGKLKAMYEPVHGSAPDISGKGLANPIACILSFSMALKYTFDLKKEAELLDKSVERVLSKGIRTADLLQKENQKPSSTKEVCNEILDELNLQL